VRRPEDIAGDTLIAFPSGCAYRRALQRWLGAPQTPSTRVLEVGSYHAIAACVASGTGVALMPASVLALVPGLPLRAHRLPRAVAHVVTPLVWRDGELSPALRALRESLRRE